MKKRATSSSKSKEHAFSLVELSIVLVILGLLVGGILSAQALIRAAELRSVTTQHQNYTAAVSSFRDKYFAYPGDFNNAQAFWGVAHATPATCVTIAGTGTQTCNGDGNGSLSNITNTSNEQFRFWQHLANAGLIQGKYDGITHGATDYSATRENAPTGRFSGALWMATDWNVVSGTTWAFDGRYNNMLTLGVSAANTDPAYPILRPEEMWNIDTKMDDGKPGLGKLVVRATSGLSACTTTVANNSATITADYLLSSQSVACAVIFRQIF